MKSYILTLSIFTFSAALASAPDPKAVNFHYGYAANQLNQAAHVARQAVTGLPGVAHESGAQFIKGALSELPKDKQLEIGTNLMKGALLGMTSQDRQQVSYDLTKGALEAGVTVAGAGLVAAKDVIVAKTVATAASAKAATITGATVAAPYVAGAVVVGAVGYGGYKFIQRCDNYCAGFAPYERCLNTYATDPHCQLNDRGLPKRCESPERKMDQLGYFGYEAKKPNLESKFRAARAKLKAAVDNRLFFLGGAGEKLLSHHVRQYEPEIPHLL